MGRTTPPSCLMLPVQGFQGELHVEGEQPRTRLVEVETVPRKEVRLCPVGGEIVCVCDPCGSAVSFKPDMKVSDAAELDVCVSW